MRRGSTQILLIYESVNNLSVNPSDLLEFFIVNKSPSGSYGTQSISKQTNKEGQAHILFIQSYWTFLLFGYLQRCREIPNYWSHQHSRDDRRWSKIIQWWTSTLTNIRFVFQCFLRWTLYVKFLSFFSGTLERCSRKWKVSLEETTSEHDQDDSSSGISV